MDENVFLVKLLKYIEKESNNIPDNVMTEIKTGAIIFKMSIIYKECIIKYMEGELDEYSFINEINNKLKEFGVSDNNNFKFGK